jgi:hypothetical protein
MLFPNNWSVTTEVVVELKHMILHAVAGGQRVSLLLVILTNTLQRASLQPHQSFRSIRKSLQKCLILLIASKVRLLISSQLH